MEKREQEMEYAEEKLLERNIVICHFFKFLISLHFIGGVLVPFFTQWGNIRFSEIMILQAIFSCSMLFLEIPTGAIADRFGRKRSVLFGSMIVVIGISIYTSVPQFWVFACGEFVWAMGVSLMSGADQALLYDSLKLLGRENESKKIMNHWSSYGMVAITIAAPIGSLLAAHCGVKSPMQLMIVPLSVGFCLGLFWTEPTSIAYKREPKKYGSIVRESLMFLKNNRIVRTLALDYMIIAAPLFFIIWAYQLILQHFLVKIQYYGYVHALMTVGQIVVLNVYPWMERKLCSKRLYLKLSGFFVAFCFGVLALQINIVLSMCAIILISGFGLSRVVVLQNYLNKHIDSDMRATVLSSISMSYRLVMTLSNVLFGALAEISITYPLFIIGGIIVVMNLWIRIKEEWLIH